MRNGTGSQWTTSRRSGVTWSYFLLLQISLAAALSTDWSPPRRHAGAPASRLLQRSTREMTKAATTAFAAQIGSDLMQLLMLRSWRKQQPTVHATWRLMDRSDSSRTPRSRIEVEGRIKAPQTLSSPVSRWIHSLLVAHHRKSVFSGLSRSLLERIQSTTRSIPSSIRCRSCATVDGGPTFKSENHRHGSGITNQDWQQAQPGRRGGAGTAAAQVRSPEGRHSRERSAEKTPLERLVWRRAQE